jgi:hypothetical protein
MKWQAKANAIPGAAKIRTKALRSFVLGHMAVRSMQGPAEVGLTSFRHHDIGNTGGHLILRIAPAGLG